MVDTGTPWLYFFTRPVAVVLMLCALVVLGSGIRQAFRETTSAEPAAEPCPGPTPAPQKQGWMNLRTANFLLAAGFAALSVYGLLEIREFSDRGALLPRVLCWLLILLSAIMLYSNARPKTGGAAAHVFPFSDVPWRYWCGTIAAFVLFGLAADNFGFYESAFVFLVVTTWMMSSGVVNPVRRWLTSIAFAVGFDALLYVIFRVILAIPTPPGPLL
jgi:hypothetical protein